LVSPCKAHHGMKWLRSNIRQGSRFALAVLCALSFGHFHAAAAQAAPAIQSGAAPSDVAYGKDLSAPDAVGESAQQPAAADHHSGPQPKDPCAICAVMTLANTVLFATPPLLLLPQALEFMYLTTDAEFVHLNSARVALQPHAPPAS